MINMLDLVKFNHMWDFEPIKEHFIYILLHFPLLGGYHVWFCYSRTCSVIHVKTTFLYEFDAWKWQGHLGLAIFDSLKDRPLFCWPLVSHIWAFNLFFSSHNVLSRPLFKLSYWILCRRVVLISLHGDLMCWCKTLNWTQQVLSNEVYFEAICVSKKREKRKEVYVAKCFWA